MAGQFLDLNNKPISPSFLSGGVTPLPWGGNFLPTPYKPTTKETIKNVGEGVVNYAGGIPKAFADSGLLNKPAAAVATKTANTIRDSSGKTILQKLIKGKPLQAAGDLAGIIARKAGVKVADAKTVEQRNATTKFSDVTSGSQVGGDPTSDTAKTTSNVLNALEIVGGVGAAGAALTRNLVKKEAAKIAAKQSAALVDQNAAKLTVGDLVGNKTLLGKESTVIGKKAKTILNMVQESDSAKNLESALGRGGIDEGQSAISKMWNGTRKIVQPSQRTIDSVGTILTEIPTARTKPQALYTQISNKVGEIASELSPKLKNIWFTNATKNTVSQSLTDLVTESADELSTSQKKHILKAVDNFTRSKNLDEVWDVAKQIDDGISDKIKSGINLNSKEEGIYKARRATRNAINDFLEEASSGISDAQVKQRFRTMSNLYHAQWQIRENIKALTKPITGLKTKVIEGTKWAAGLGAAGALGGIIGSRKGGTSNSYTQTE